MLHDVIPHQVYRGQEIQYIVNPMQALHWKLRYPGDLPIKELSLGGFLTNWSETIDADTKITAFTYRDPLTTYVGNHPPTKDAKPRALFRVGDSYVMNTAKHCNFKGTECWNVKVHPVIDKISASEGSVLGGQELRIEGFGFSGDAEVLIDGIKCKINIEKSSDELIVCSTGEKKDGQPSQNGYQPGSPGLIQTTIKPENGNTMPSWADRTNDKHTRTKSHLTTFETHVQDLNKDARLINGFFKAPATGDYSFRLSSDDSSKFFLSQDAYNSETAEPQFQDSEAVAYRNKYCYWRDFFAENPVGPSASEWIHLEEGQFYPMEAYMREHRSLDHLTVAVEFKTEETANHPHAGKEIQLLEIKNNGLPEAW